MLSAGFIVDAIDPDPHAAELAAALGNPRLLLQCADIRDVELAERSYNIIVATHVLHLIPRADLHRLMAKIAGWLIDGAIFCATFLGTRDSWAPTPWRATVLRPDEVLELASGLEVIRLDELEYEGTNVLGEPKHWHTLRCLLRNRRADSGRAYDCGRSRLTAVASAGQFGLPRLPIASPAAQVCDRNPVNKRGME